MAILPQPAAPMQPPLHIGRVLTVFGHVLPPAMQWQRTFQMCLPVFSFAEIPKFVFKTDFGSLLLTKCSWDICYNGADVSFSLQPPSKSSFNLPCQASPVRRLVARALCFDDLSAPVTESFEFSAVPEVTTKRGRKPRSAKILVDTEVRRSARLSALRG